MASELQSVLKETDPLARAMRMDRLFARLDRENLPGAIEVYREAARRGEVLGAVRFLGRWSEIDNAGLIENLRDWPDDQAQAQGYGWAIYRLALDDQTTLILSPNVPFLRHLYEDGKPPATP